MAYQEEEKTRVRRQATKQAIALAMQGRWQEVVAVNKSLLESFPNDVEAYNRLGRAYMELGEFALAREVYGKALELDPYNTIAKKNLNRLSYLRETEAGAGGSVDKVEPQQFIEETGKAGVVKLYRLAPPEVLARLVTGSKVSLKIDNSSLTVENSRGEYVGQVEPRHGQRLIRLMEGGNQYSAAIVSAAGDAATVIIREEYQHPSQVGPLSFPPKGDEALWPPAGDRLIRREIEYEEVAPGEPAYTIVGGEEGEETELLPEEVGDTEEEENEQ